MNKDIRAKTLDAYNNSAKELAEYFAGIGSREKCVNIAMSTNGLKNPKVLEIGCGDGRDAEAIVSVSSSYLGFDISKEMIAIAKNKVPEGEFVVADAVDFDYGENQYDIVFAFASLLHLDMEEVELVFDRVEKCLRAGGVFFVSLKLSEDYKEIVKKDRFGERQFFLYSPENIRNIAKHKFSEEYFEQDFTTAGNTKWFDMAFKKL